MLLEEAASAAGKSGPAFEQSSILSPLLSGKGETERQRLCCVMLRLVQPPSLMVNGYDTLSSSICAVDVAKLSAFLLPGHSEWVTVSQSSCCMHEYAPALCSADCN